MAHGVRNSWPLYLVTESETERVPLELNRIVLASASFAFARLFCHHLELSLGKKMGVIRVTYYNRSLPVGSQSSAFVTKLDSRWCRPPCVTEKAYCVLCIKTHGQHNTCLEGLSVSPDLGTVCQAHQLNWAPQLKHERLQLNAVSKQWYEGNTAKACAALRSAKLAWTGPLYFARAVSNMLPVDIVNYIVAISCEQPDTI